MSFKIAIDGPSASGKTEVSKRLAKRLNITAVDSGAIYRAVALYCLNNNIDIYNNNQVVDCLSNIHVNLIDDKVYMNSQDVSKDIRKSSVGIATSVVASIGEVREYVSKVQRRIATKDSVVMQGRDITSVVLPDAELKIYLNADVKVRALRRMKELEEKGEKISFDEVLENIQKRDNKDMTRIVSPLIKTKDSIEIDTTNISLDEVVEKIINLVKERGLE